MALHRADYLRDQDAFLIRRTFSARQLVDYTKTKRQHLIPCHSEFKKVMQKIPIRMDSPYFFVNPRGKLEGQPYTHCTMRVIWIKACQDAGEDIDMYSGLKHSSCSQYVKEKGYVNTGCFCPLFTEIKCPLNTDHGTDSGSSFAGSSTSCFTARARSPASR